MQEVYLGFASLTNCALPENIGFLTAVGQIEGNRLLEAQDQRQVYCIEARADIAKGDELIWWVEYMNIM